MEGRGYSNIVLDTCSVLEQFKSSRKVFPVIPRGETVHQFLTVSSQQITRNQQKKLGCGFTKDFWFYLQVAIIQNQTHFPLLKSVPLANNIQWKAASHYLALEMIHSRINPFYSANWKYFTLLSFSLDSFQIRTKKCT